MLFDRRQPLYSRGDDRARIAKARQEAEALFALKRPIKEPRTPDPLAPADQSPRKPRILRALSPVPVRHEDGEAPVSSGQRTQAEIPSSQFTRIRTWVKYGMTPAQVAGIYGVAVDVIERILRKA